MRQIKYTRPCIPNESLGQSLPILNLKIYVPDHFQALLEESTSMIIPSTASTDSFFHALLYILYPSYKIDTWDKKIDYVNLFIHELGTTGTLEPHKDTRLMTHLTNLLNVNIIIVTKKTLVKYICAIDSSSIFLYVDDLAVYQPVVINSSYLIYNYK
jgi:hypothetical protein